MTGVRRPSAPIPPERPLGEVLNQVLSEVKPNPEEILDTEPTKFLVHFDVCCTTDQLQTGPRLFVH